MTENPTWPDWMHSCTNCGKRFVEKTDPVVTAATGENGYLNLYSFCDENCRSVWARTSDAADV